jgi:NADPH:quinone reductase
MDGVTGGVGQFAIQLAAASGARGHSHIRRETERPVVEAWSTGGVIVGETLEAARPFDLILESVCGSALSAALTMLRRNGASVTLGGTEGAMVSFDNAAFFRASGTSLLSLILSDEIAATEPRTAWRYSFAFSKPGVEADRRRRSALD